MPIVGALMQAGGSIAGGVLSGHAAGDAGNVMSQAATQAQQLELQNQQNAIASQNAATSANQANEAPYQALGSTSAASLQNLLQQGFQAPTLAQAQQNPGYQFALQSGTHALNEQGAATGNLMSGTQGTALQQYGQQLGEQNYQQVYNNALQNYMANYQTLQGGTNTGLSSTAELGQVGQAGAQNLANVDLTGGAQQAQQINNAAAARASGYLGTAAAYSGMANQLANIGSNYFSGGMGGQMGGGGGQ